MDVVTFAAARRQCAKRRLRVIRRARFTHGPLFCGATVLLVCFVAGLFDAHGKVRGAAQGPSPSVDPIAARIDPYVAKQRVIVMTDIANEPDDQMSMVRFLVYANQFDVEGLVATTSTWMKNKVRPDVIHSLLDAYEQVQPNLLHASAGVSRHRRLRAVVVAGQPAYGMAAVGAGQDVAQARISSSRPPERRMRDRSGSSPGEARTRSPRRC